MMAFKGRPQLMGHVGEELGLEAAGLQHPPFELLALRDVANRARYERAAVGLQRAETDLDRKLRPVFPQAEQVETDAHAARPRFAKEVAAVPRVRPAEPLGHEQFDPLADEFLTAVSEEPLRLRVDQDDAPVPVDDDHRVGRGLQQVLESLLGLLSVTDVADRHGDERLVVHVEGAQADFHRELGAILPQPGELEAGSHRPDARLREETAPVSRMRRTDTFRDEDFHRLAQELRPGIAEHPFGLCVDNRDVAVTVHDHDRIRRRFEQAPELRLARLQLAQASEHRGVTLADGDQRLVISSMHHHADRNQRTVLVPANSFYRDRAIVQGAAQIGRGFGAECVRNRQVGNPPADSFLRRETEHRLCAAVPREDATVVGHGQ